MTFFDRKARLLLMLGMLNDVYADTASTVVNLRDFMSSHPEMREEIEEFGLNDLLSSATEFEKRVLEVMEKLKAELYRT
ncbi:hypothetical protein Arcve_1409 [Archaeoglobus veneficus SNP6]|uniref:Uncharacterized protein n=1 Tax=Archaeoglobus veneficus (strain DSM 11195 / SNP6) TaxID=693661 RepID=F2KNT6_ARCVS|nr:hypothetical protein Arcve_1409 [Archaeoglobus veneficus SNP6]